MDLFPFTLRFKDDNVEHSPLMSRYAVERGHFLLLQVQLIQNKGSFLLSQDYALSVISLVVLVVVLVVGSRLLLKQVCQLLLLVLTLKECCKTGLSIQTLETNIILNFTR